MTNPGYIKNTEQDFLLVSKLILILPLDTAQEKHLPVKNEYKLAISPRAYSGSTQSYKN